MVCMSFLQSPQKHNQRTFTSTYRRYSVLLNANEEKKKISRKQSVEEADDDDEVISNVGGNNSTDDLSELDDEMETGSINFNPPKPEEEIPGTWVACHI